MRQRALAVVGHFTNVFTVSASHRERKRSQACFGDLASALGTVAVAPFVDSTQRGVNLVERLRLHLNQREFDVVLSIDLGALCCVEHITVRDTVAAHVTNLVLHVVHEFRASTFENRVEVPKAVRFRPSLRFSCEHEACPLLYETCAPALDLSSASLGTAAGDCVYVVGAGQHGDRGNEWAILTFRNESAGFIDRLTTCGQATGRSEAIA